MQKTKSLILGIVCLIFGLSQSQWLETKIPGGDLPCALVWNSTNNKVYCAKGIL